MRALPEAALVPGLSGDDALIGVSAPDKRHYAFHEAGAGVVAQLEIEPGAPARAPPAAFPSVGTRNGESLAPDRMLVDPHAAAFAALFNTACNNAEAAAVASPPASLVRIVCRDSNSR